MAPEVLRHYQTSIFKRMAKGIAINGQLRGKLGGTVYYRSNGQQISRSKAENVSNPNTQPQRIQRMIMATVMQAYSLTKLITDHSFEGIKYKQDSMAFFQRVNANKLRAMISAEEPAFDPSFTGESGGQPRFMASPDINTEDFMAAVDFLSLNDKVDADRIGIIGICGWGGMALNTAALDTRIKATVASTMYDMTRVNAKGYFDSEDSEEQRYAHRAALCAQRLADLKAGEYALGGGVIDPLPDDAPYFVKDYHAYYKTDRGYHARSLNSNGGWNIIGCESFMNQPILKYTNEIRNAVLVMHGDKAHSFYFGKDAYEDMINGNKYTDNKEFLVIEGASHTDLYDGGDNNAIPFDKLQEFFEKYL